MLTETLDCEWHANFYEYITILDELLLEIKDLNHNCKSYLNEST